MRAVPRRGRFRRRQRRRRPHPRVPGHPPAPRQDHQRLQVARRQGAGQRRGPQHDLRHRRRHRRRNGPQQTPLQQDRHHDRRRRRRLAHPHAAADVLLPPDVRPGERRLRLRGPAAAVPRAAQEGSLLRADRRGDEGPTARRRPDRRRVRAGRRADRSRARRWSASAARWPRWRIRCWPWSAAASASAPTPCAATRPPAGCPSTTSSSASRSTGSPPAKSSTSSWPPRSKRSARSSTWPTTATARRAKSSSPAANCTSSNCTRSARSTTNWPRCASMGFEIDSLIPQERTGVEEPRYRLRRGELTTGLEDLRGLLAAIRAAGEKGLQVTRFKGLGEMNAEELRETTLDPANRTLLASEDGRRRRRRRPLPHPDGRQGRAPPRVHRETRDGSQELGCISNDFPN